jgi:exodeoxyribonuclease VII small subunit
MSKKNFETSLEKLEELVGSLENGELSLDESIDQFENGIKLYKSCRELLDKAEKKVNVLTDDLNEQEYNDQ